MMVNRNAADNSIVLLFLTAYIFRFYFANGQFIFLTIWLFVFFLALHSLFSHNRNRRNSVIFLVLALIFSIFLVLSLIFGGTFLPLQSIIALGNLIIGLALTRIKFIRKYSIFLLTSLFIFYSVKILNGVHPNDVYIISQNFISITLLYASCFYILASEEEKKEYSFPLILISFILCVWGVGRSGIASLFILLIGIFFLQKRIYKLVIVLSIILFVNFVTISQLDIEIYAYGLLRLIERADIIDIRSHVNREYLDIIKSSYQYLVFGGDINRSKVIMDLDANPHNSFIKLHYIYGILGFATLTAMLIFSCAHHAFNKKFLSILVVLALLIRSATDIAFVGGPLDILIYIVIFRGLVYYNPNQKLSPRLSKNSIKKVFL